MSGGQAASFESKSRWPLPIFLLQIPGWAISTSPGSSSENVKNQLTQTTLGPKSLQKLEYLSRNCFFPPACLPKRSPGTMGQLQPVCLVGAKPVTAPVLLRGRWKVGVQCTPGLHGQKSQRQTPRSSGARGQAGGRSHFIAWAVKHHSQSTGPRSA